MTAISNVQFSSTFYWLVSWAFPVKFSMIICQCASLLVWLLMMCAISVRDHCEVLHMTWRLYCNVMYKNNLWDHLNRHQTILQTFLNFFLNLTLSDVPHLYKQLPNGQYLSDLCKMCYLDANLWKRWIGDHRILTYIFKWERLNTAGHSHSVSIGHWVAPLHND